MASLVTLMYHRLGAGALPDREPGENIYTVSPSVFEQQIELLTRSKCSVVDLPTAVTSSAPLPRRATAISFDDGNASDYEVALPILIKHGFPATFFITPDWVGSATFMDWAQVKELSQHDGMVIGAHGLDHTPLSSLREPELSEHLREARRIIQARIGTAPMVISVPGGYCDERVVKAAFGVGFQLVADSVPKRRAASDSSQIVPRFAIRGADSLAGFAGLVEQRAMALLRRSLRYNTIGFAKRALGEQLYQRLRSWSSKEGHAGDR